MGYYSNTSDTQSHNLELSLEQPLKLYQSYAYAYNVLMYLCIIVMAGLLYASLILACFCRPPCAWS